MSSLKKFEILEMIAKGGMAEVYKAKTVGFQGFEKDVCVKKILPHLTEDESFVTMFINEAKLAATLNYANIVQVHDLCVSANGEYFIVMEYVHGKDLSDVIRAAQLAGREVPADIAVYVMREACKALYFAHTRTDASGAPLGLIHRDVSPHNVLVSFMGEVKLTDFGIAKASSIMNKTAVGILKGKYGYMSPEQARGQPLDHRSDIFNTGIVLYELLVGERCFAGSSDFSTLNLMRNAEVTAPTKINKHLSTELEGIVLKALSRDAKDRYQDALEMERALGKYAKGRGQVAQATDLGVFMKELFSSSESERKAGTSTGVLSLSSIVGPPPRSDDEKAAHASIPKKEAAPPEKNGDVGKDAAARLKRKATKAKSSSAPPIAEPKIEEKPEPPVEKTAAVKPKEKKAETKPEKKAEPAKAEPPKQEPPKAEPAKAEAKEEPEKKERKPARIKKDGDGEEKEKKKGKQLGDAEKKKPVGKKDLRPGLTQIRALQGGNRRRTLTSATILILLAGVLGGGVGYYRAKQLSRQQTFRDMELATREGPRPAAVTILVSSSPPGATVLFDSIEMSGATPMALDRDRDDKEHTITFKMKNHSELTRTVRYSDGVITKVHERLSGTGGRLEITSKPDGLAVHIDGAKAGTTPLDLDVSVGPHTIRFEGPNRHPVEATIDIEKGKTAKLHRAVPEVGQIASVKIDTTRPVEIWVDGRPTGRWTGDGPLELAPNVDHRVTLKGKRDEEILVNLKEGQKKKIFLDIGA